jgi:hypothetical protein
VDVIVLLLVIFNKDSYQSFYTHLFWVVCLNYKFDILTLILIY